MMTYRYETIRLAVTFAIIFCSIPCIPSFIMSASFKRSFVKILAVDPSDEPAEEESPSSKNDDDYAKNDNDSLYRDDDADFYDDLRRAKNNKFGQPISSDEMKQAGATC